MKGYACLFLLMLFSCKNTDVVKQVNLVQGDYDNDYIRVVHELPRGSIETGHTI